jgi:hypothetical protein
MLRFKTWKAIITASHLARAAIVAHPAWLFALRSQRDQSDDKLSFATSSWWIKMNSSKPRVGEFCPSNIIRLLLGVIIIVTLVTAIGFWLYQSPGHGQSIEQPAQSPAPAK